MSRLPTLKRSDDWKYLGIPFTPEGKSTAKIAQGLQDTITKLSEAALKPQQRLFALRTMVIPGIYHKIELGNTSISLLRKCEAIVRHSARKWLALPADTPNAYFHASVRNGGLGLEAVRWTAPLRRLNRLKSLPLARDQAGGVPGAFLNNKITMCNRRLLFDGAVLASASDISKK